MPDMVEPVQISDSGQIRMVVGDVMRFEAVNALGSLLVDIDLVAWTVLRDRHPDILGAVRALEALARHGRWQTKRGTRSLVVSLGPLIIDEVTAPN
ncbi:hypothetical protein [Sphingomonas crocodyli]|uniref:Uncharacterized protein n=1 Tax=Sphingomonas crocodyli TaxID=1979270 RepID=A0A437LYF6_9SPHN|nr:hypothetical protein [Sphingomonas crocodyli]RVT90458.1 hypothetical protein EOD43_19590 [Sphingomonas crocodyli]